MAGAPATAIFGAEMSPAATSRHVPPDPEWENYFSREAERAESLEALLRRVPAFDGLEPGDLATLVRQVHVRTFAHGEVVLRQGAPRSGFYVIRSGSVHLSGEDPGGVEIIDTLVPPAIIGRFALLDESPAPATFIAAERSELVGFFRTDLMEIAATDPGLGCRIMLRLGEAMAAALNRDYASLEALGWPFEDRGEGPASRI